MYLLFVCVGESRELGIRDVMEGGDGNGGDCNLLFKNVLESLE
jgi:hypothetical protein